MIDPIGDTTVRALSQALNGLSLRQRTIADNVANVETPRFLAGKVDFESSLLAAVADGQDPETATIDTPRSLEPTRANGNNVNLDEETLAGVQTGLTYQLGVQAMTDHFQRLRIAMGGNA
ncbi:flagellar basal-body rod protein FlgB [Salmonella enterica subsp. enterica serovar Javiana]|nr:flagellar basal-body rod protein FlgB [Salmonella enterica subsp. enterica serovar Javiana]